MMRKFLVGLLCLAVILMPTITNAAGITNSDLSSHQEKLKSTSTSDNVDLTVGKVHMLKSVSNNFIVLTFAEDGGFTEDTYNSILAALKVILNETYYNHFVKNYPSLSNKSEISFTGFRVKNNPQKLNDEAQTFADANIIRVEICSDEFDEISSSTPSETTTPTPTPTPSETPAPEASNPSTGDMNLVILGSIIVIATLGAYISIRKIREN